MILNIALYIVFTCVGPTGNYKLKFCTVTSHEGSKCQKDWHLLIAYRRLQSFKEAFKCCDDGQSVKGHALVLRKQS